VQGEVAINVTDKKVWVGNAATTPVQLLGTGASGNFSALTVTSLTDSGNLTFTGTGNRINGDFTDATVTNKVIFQTSTANSPTTLSVAPSGSNTNSYYDAWHVSSGFTNTAYARFGTDGALVRVESSIVGSGTYLPLTMFTGGGERLRIDTSGNVGIGTSSPTSKLDVVGAGNPTLTVRGSDGAYTAILKLQAAGGGSSVINATGASSDALIFQTTGTERMRIDSSGNLLVGATNTTGRISSTNDGTFNAGATPANIQNTSFVSYGSYGGGFTVLDGSQGYVMYAQSSGADFYIRRGTTSSGLTGGVYLSNAAGSWSSASDERLKNIIRPIENAVEKLKDYRCVIGEYKDNEGVERPFLIAQDVQKTFPEAVNVMNTETGYLGLSYTELTPLLIKAIQELKAEVDALKAQINQ
jgi:hypothetical protein